MTLYIITIIMITLHNHDRYGLNLKRVRNVIIKDRCQQTIFHLIEKKV